jgi:hypothetical protein
MMTRCSRCCSAARIFLLGFLLVPLVSEGAAQDVYVGRDRLVDGDDPTTAYTEPVITTHPEDPNRFAVVAIRGFTRQAAAPGWYCASWQTRDGGETWRRLDIDLSECADPTSVLDERGRLHVAVLGGGGGVTVLRSDRGHRWNSRQRVRGADHPVLVRAPSGLLLVSTATQRSGGDLVSGLLVARSEDDGATFQVVGRSIQDGTRANAVAPAVLDDGTVVHGVSVFMERRGRRLRFLDQERLLAHRQKAGALGPPVEIGRDCQTRVGFPTLVAGADAVYAVCVGAGARDILVYASPDEGESWLPARGVFGGSRPILEPNETIERGSSVLRREVGASANQDGVLGIVWQDREGDRSRRCQRVMFTASRDGGRTFTPPVRVSGEDSCPDNPQNREAGRQWPGGTDYGAIAAAADGSFVVAWADARNGAYQIRTARIRVGS